MNKEKTLLILCAALALGEGAAALSPSLATLWPVLCIAGAFVILFGFGLCIRGWTVVLIVLLGLCLFYRSSISQERLYREKPWLRHARHHQQTDARTFPAFAQIRRDFSHRLGFGLDHNSELANLNRAILLGERARLPAQTRRTFIGAGTIHIFAISGLHIMIVARVIEYLLLLFRMPLRLSGLISLPILWFYVLLIGSPPSALRAALMASFYFLAPLFWRRSNALVAWELTFLGVHLVRPAYIADVGSLLSFTVMFAILLTARLVRDALPYWQQNLAISLAAWAAGVPIAAHAFGRITIGGLLANLALIPAAGITVVSGILGLLASFFSRGVAAHLNNAAALFTNAMVDVSKIVAELPGANFETRPWNYLECALWYALMILVPFVCSFWRSRRLF